ncbi:MAG: dihydrodipicolinate synthase family protein, partial [Acidobacteriota bacterium]
MNYAPKRGLNVPAVSVVDDAGRVIADQQRRVFRHLVQNGRGADMIFGVGTTGEWNRLANSERLRIMEIQVDEVRCINSELATTNPQSAHLQFGRNPQSVEAWLGVNGKTRAEI